MLKAVLSMFFSLFKNDKSKLDPKIIQNFTKPLKMEFQAPGHTDLTNFLKFFFNASYFLLFCPFRLCLNHVDNCGKLVQYFSTKSHGVHKLICASCSFLSFLWLIKEFRVAILQGNPKDINLHFRTVSNILDWMAKLVTLKKLWVHREEIVTLLNFILEVGASVPINFHIRVTLPIGLILMHVGTAFLGWLAGSGVMFENFLTDWSPRGWWSLMVHGGRVSFFIDRVARLDNGVNLAGNQSTDIIFGTLGAVAYLQRRLMGTFTDLFVVMAVLTLNMATRCFSSKLRSNGSMSWQKVHGEYKSLKKLSVLINTLIGTNVALFVPFATVYFATSLEHVFLGNLPMDFGRMARTAFFYLDELTILLVSADVCHRLASLGDWIADDKHRDTVPVRDLQYVLFELDQHTVAIKGRNIFPITYSLVGNVCDINICQRISF